jgi:hypothetical protein
MINGGINIILICIYHLYKIILLHPLASLAFCIRNISHLIQEKTVLSTNLYS